MLLSDDKISHLSHLVLNALKKKPKGFFLAGEEKVLQEIKRGISRELQVEDEIDRFVRQKLSSYSRPLSEGSPEWMVLYNKFFEEELRKKKR